MKASFRKNCIVMGILIILLATQVVSSLESTVSREVPLPPPLDIDMIYEEALFRRMSVREFTEEPVTDEDLATVLWAAYALRDDGKRTVTAINGSHAAIIYVLREDGAYTYDGVNHSLVLYKEGDYRDIILRQYPAPIQLGLCWDTRKTEKNLAAVELAEIGQNIALIANALGLGTVVTGQHPPAIEPLGLPEYEEGVILMPLGHPTYHYDFVYKPHWFSFLPKVQHSTMNLSTAIRQRNETSTYSGELSTHLLSQLLWASYGYSYYFDHSNNTIGRLGRHRTIPSAHAYYPLHMYAVTSSGIYRYVPNLYDPIYGLLRNRWNLPIFPLLLKYKDGDFRKVLGLVSSDPAIASAPLCIITVLDLRRANHIFFDDYSGEEFWYLWYYDSGSAAQNVLLEATAWNLTGNIVFPIDTDALSSLLTLPNRYVPLVIIPISE